MVVKCPPSQSENSVERLKHFPRPLKVMEWLPNELRLEASYSAGSTQSLISSCKLTLATCNWISHRKATFHSSSGMPASCYLVSSQAAGLWGGSSSPLDTTVMVSPVRGMGNSWHWEESSKSVPNLADVLLDHDDQERMGMERTEDDSDRAKDSICHEGSKTTAGSPKLWIPWTSPCFIRSARHSDSLERNCQGWFVQKDTFWRGS